MFIDALSYKKTDLKDIQDSLLVLCSSSLLRVLTWPLTNSGTNGSNGCVLHQLSRRIMFCHDLEFKSSAPSSKWEDLALCGRKNTGIKLCR